MKKILAAVIIFLSLAAVSFSQETILRGNAAYNADIAKELALDGIEMKLDKKMLKEYLVDENNAENLQALKDNKQPDGRYLMSFSIHKFVKGYVIVYEDKPEYAFYYTTSGYLAAVDVDKHFGSDFPYRVGKYNPVTGNLVSIGVYVSEDEQYAYTKDGKLKAHWISDTGYNDKGKPIAKRAVVNEIPEN